MNVEAKIPYGPPLFHGPDGRLVQRTANLALDPETAEKIFPGVTTGERHASKKVIVQEPFLPSPQVDAAFLHTTMGINIIAPSIVVEEGTTVPRGCAHGGEKGCQTCMFAKTPVATTTLEEANCAVANTLKAFEAVQQQGKGRFAMFPVSDNVIVMNNDTDVDPITLTDESGAQQSAFTRLKSGRAVVFGEKWLEENNIEDITVGLHGADAAFGLASLEVADESFVIAFCTIRNNLGDRDENAQVIRKAIDAIYEQKGITGDTKAADLADKNVRIDIGVAATLPNFAHDIKIPEPGSDPAKQLAAYMKITNKEYKKRYEARAIIEEYDQRLEETTPNETVRDLAKKTMRDYIKTIHPTDVMNWQYPGALRNGFVYGEMEAQAGILEPRTEEGCPGEGELCHIDYRGITKYSIRRQLQAVGIQEEHISYNETHAVDPGDKSNNLASNRNEQLAGVPAALTNRTFSAAHIRFSTQNS